jgi:hypothetical protein
MKKVSIGTKPSLGPKKQTIDDWVEAVSPAEQPRVGVVEPMKRLTIDVPRSLHTRIKSGCVLRGLQMCDVIRDLLEQQFPK